MSVYDVKVRDDTPGVQCKETIQRSAVETLRSMRAQPGSLTVVLTDEDTVRQMNRTFRGIDHSTDVLSFPDSTHDPDTGTLYYGDIVIAASIAAEQAHAAGNPFEDELLLLTVHGVLHLLGMEHDDQISKKAMWEIQSSVLKQLGASTAV